MSVAERIKELRSSLYLSQEELAEKIGVQRNTVWRWENGRASPMESASKISAALNTSIAYLMGETDEPKYYPGVTANNGSMAIGSMNGAGHTFSVSPIPDIPDIEEGEKTDKAMYVPPVKSDSNESIVIRQGGMEMIFPQSTPPSIVAAMVHAIAGERTTIPC